VVALWAGAVLALAAIQLERSADRLAEGDLSGAAEAARSAARIEPWSQEPSLRLAEIEQAAANFEAARRRAEEAARLAPEDFRPWLLLSQIHAAGGEPALAAVYATRALALAPRAFAPSRPVGGT
jgi:tetratricopeptide (TPR) repeat protein